MLMIGLLSLNARANAPASDLFRNRSGNVLASYTNWYRGDDDAIGHCVVSDDGTGILLGDGIVPPPAPIVFRVSGASLQALKNAVHTLPSGLKGVMTVIPESGQGYPAFAASGPDGLVQVASTSDVARIMEAICNMESRD